MDSDILRWLLLIVAAIVLFVWYMSYLLSSRHTDSKKRTQDNSPPEEHPDTLLGEKPSADYGMTEEQPITENLVIVSVDSRDEREFYGSDVINGLTTRGLAYGKYSIYHRHIQSEGSERLVYSVINGVEPGHLDGDFAESTTPSIIFFIDLDRSHNPLRAFSEMLEAAQDIAAQLGGSVCDSDHNPLTEQTISYMRDKISEQERNRQLKASH